MKFDLAEIRKRIARYPHHFTIPAALVIAVILLAIARLVFGGHDRSQRPDVPATTPPG